jgi:hypothetical protein
MSVIDEIIKLLSGGVRVGPFDGSHNGHKTITVDQANSGVHLDAPADKFTAQFKFSENTAAGTVDHTINGSRPLAGGGAHQVTLDGSAVTNGKIVLKIHLAPLPRLEVLFEMPVTGNPDNHYRFDGDVRPA